MTDIQYTPHLVDKQVETGPNATWGMSIAAAALAVLIGLSAAGIQGQNLAGADQSPALEQTGAALDGRGKWAGYM